MGGNVVIETVFSWPGIGRMLVQAVSVHDYPLAQGAFLMIAAVLAVMNFVADLLYTDPGPASEPWPKGLTRAGVTPRSCPRGPAGACRRWCGAW